MQLKIGENIKRLRHKNGMTQEQLAEMLGVSYVAVSKWESMSTCPDISLLIPLSEIFGVTTDELLGVDSNGFEDRVHAQVDELWRISKNRGSADDYLAAARRAVAEVPVSEELRIMLFGALIDRTCLSDEPGENMDVLLREAQRLGKTLLNDTKDADRRTRLIESMVSLYSYGFNDNEKAAAVAQEATPIDRSRELIKSGWIRGCEREYCQSAIDSLVRNLDETIRQLALSDGDIDVDTRLMMLWTSEQNIRMIYGDDLQGYHYSIAWSELAAARILADNGRADEAFAALDKMCDHIIVYDKWRREDLGRTYDSPFVSSVVGGKKSDMYIPDEYNGESYCQYALCQLNSAKFNRIRNDKRFKSILDKLDRNSGLY